VADHTRGVGHSRVEARKHAANSLVVADRTRGVGYVPVAAHKHTVVAHVVTDCNQRVGHSPLVADRAWGSADSRVAADKHRAAAQKLADRTQGVRHSRADPDKRVAVANSRVVAERTAGAGQSRVAIHNRMALARHRVAGSHPGLQHDREMRPRRAALRWRQSQCKRWRMTSFVRCPQPNLNTEGRSSVPATQSGTKWMDRFRHFFSNSGQPLAASMCTKCAPGFVGRSLSHLMTTA
jgi:hypothetical protein